MFGAALSILSGSWKQILVGLAIVAVVLAAYFWAYNRGAASRQGEIEHVIAQHNEMVVAAERARAQAEAEARAREAKLRTRVAEQATEIDDAHRTNAEQTLALQKYATTADAASVAASRLRDQLATARIIAGETSGDPAGSCNARANSYEALLARSSDLLRRGRDLAIRCAGAHDDRAAEVIGLVKAWPK